MPPLSYTCKISKATNLCGILSWYFCPASTFFSFLRLHPKVNVLCVSFTYRQSFLTVRSCQIANSMPISSSERSDIKYTRMSSLSMKMWSVWLWIFLSGAAQVYVWNFNVVKLWDLYFWKLQTYPTRVLSFLLMSKLPFFHFLLNLHPSPKHCLYRSKNFCVRVFASAMM